MRELVRHYWPAHFCNSLSCEKWRMGTCVIVMKLVGMKYLGGLFFSFLSDCYTMLQKVNRNNTFGDPKHCYKLLWCSGRLEFWDTCRITVASLLGLQVTFWVIQVRLGLISGDHIPVELMLLRFIYVRDSVTNIHSAPPIVKSQLLRDPLSTNI